MCFFLIQSYELSVPDNSFNNLCTHKEIDLREKNSLYIPDHALDNAKDMTRWKYKDVDGHLSKRKFNAYKNSWESDWISYSKQN